MPEHSHKYEFNVKSTDTRIVRLRGNGHNFRLLTFKAQSSRAETHVYTSNSLTVKLCISFSFICLSKHLKFILIKLFELYFVTALKWFFIPSLKKFCNLSYYQSKRMYFK